MYDSRPNLVIGFHGCDREIRDKLLQDPDQIKKSEKPYDWLGHGMYFWEYNETRALEWAEEYVRQKRNKEAAVIGDLGNCCDLLDSKYIEVVAAYYTLMKLSNDTLGKPMPQNTDVKGDKHKDKLKRELDCAVIEFMNERIFTIQQKFLKEGHTNIKLFDSVRGAFMEGGEAFPGSGIQRKNHIQICIRNPNNILGFFLPRKEVDFVKMLRDEYERKKS
jgi:hypothetical protein